MSARALLRVGNDVVDLANDRTKGKSTDERFVARIFSPAEQSGIEAAPDSDLELWQRWAAKEAAFKVVSKTWGAPPPFEHSKFVSEWTGEAHKPTRSGTVRYSDQVIAIEVEARSDSSLIHAVAWNGPLAELRGRIVWDVRGLAEDGAPWSGDERSVRSRLTPRELEAVHSHASAAVRVGAKGAIAMQIRSEESVVEVVCAPGPLGRMPPEVLVDGAPANVDVSLSHDGPWIAWAVLSPPSN